MDVQATGGLTPKDPAAQQWPRGIDWTDYLAGLPDGETIATSAWVVTGSDALLTIDDDSIVTGSLRTQVRLSGGTLGVRYTVTNHVVTSSGVVDERSFVVLIEDL